MKKNKKRQKQLQKIETQITRIMDKAFEDKMRFDDWCFWKHTEPTITPLARLQQEIPNYVFSKEPWKVPSSTHTYFLNGLMEFKRNLINSDYPKICYMEMKGTK